MVENNKFRVGQTVVVVQRGYRLQEGNTYVIEAIYVEEGETTLKLMGLDSGYYARRFEPLSEALPELEGSSLEDIHQAQEIFANLGNTAPIDDQR